MMKLSRFSSILFVLFCFAAPAFGQMMGMSGDDTAAAAAPVVVVEAPPPAWSDFFERIVFEWNRYLGPESPYRGLVLCILTLILLSMVYRHTTRAMTKYLREQAYSQDNAEAFLKTWRIVWKFVIAVFTILALSGSLKMLGLSAGFLGMILGWSLQAPVTGLAAWLMIIAKKPFRLGDRIVVAGYTGDVTDITLTHVVLNQVGGSVGGEERSGRGILIPNAILFSNVIINFTFDQKYMLDEVIVRLTFDSDMQLAEKLCLEAVHEVTADIIKESGFEPNIRAELYDSGVLVRVRYQTIPSERQRISTQVTRGILTRVKEHYWKVQFCYPHSVVRYRSQNEGDQGVSVPPPLDDQPSSAKA
jgi:small-conductance mechanosensitive channel